jgi:hypothetical protein
VPAQARRVLRACLEKDPKRRLHYTVQNLNRGQKPASIHFFINGNGQLVRWQPIAAPRKARRSATR